MARKVDTHGETIGEEIKEHRDLMKHNARFRKAVEGGRKGKKDREPMSKR